jgi:hypothetical protein
MSQRLRTDPCARGAARQARLQSDPSRRPWLGAVVSAVVLLGVDLLAPGEAAAGGPSVGAGTFADGLVARPLVPLAPLLAAPPAPPPTGGPGAAIPVQPPPPAPTEDDDAEEDDDELDTPEQPRGERTRARRATYELEPPELLSKRTIPPFWLKREYDTHTTSALTFPPLYVHRQPKPGHPETLAHFDLSFTIAYYARNRDKQRWMNPLVLFFYGTSEHKTVWAALPLLMGYRRIGDQFNFGQFPFAWWWGNKHVKNLFVFPFHFHKRAPDQHFAVSGLFAWYGHKHLDDNIVDNDRRHFVFAPVFFRFQRGLKTIDASPLYFGGKNLTTGVTHRTLLPFFHWQSREFGNRKELWTLPWIQRSDEARGRSAWAVPPLLVFRDRKPERDLLSVTPLVWRRVDQLHARTTWVVGPGGAVSDPHQHISWLAPLWWRFKDRRADTAVSVLAPLAVWRSSPERFSLHTLVASAWRNRGEGLAGRGGGGGSLPLLTWVSHSPLRSRQFVLGGLFWRFTNEDPAGTGAPEADARRSAWGAGPLVYRSTRGREQARFGIPPLLTFTGRDGSKSHQVVTPLFWHYRDRDPANTHDTWVTPPFYFQKRAEGFRVGLPPVFVAANDERLRYAVLPFLLFGHVHDKLERSQRTVSPLFLRIKTPEARLLGVGLLAWDVRRDVEAGGQAVAGAGVGEPGELVRERDSLLFPLYYRRQRGDRTWHVSPLGGGMRGPDRSAWAATLVYGFTRPDDAGQLTRRGGGVAPLIHHETRYDSQGERVGATTTVVPLFIRDRRPEGEFDMWTPLIWRTKVDINDKPRRNLAVVPLYFRQRQSEGIDVDAGLVFFWSRDHVRRTHTVVAGPFYHRLQRDKLVTGFGPLSYWEDSSKRRLLVVPPLIVSFEDKQARSRTTVGLPLWFDRVQANGRRVWMAFPFVVGEHRRNDFTKAGVAFPLFYDIFRLHKNFRFTGVVPLVFRYQKGGFKLDDDPADRYTLWGSFPLFFHGSDGHGRRSHSALGLYWWDRNPEGFKFYTLLAGVSQKPGKELAWYAPLVYRKVTNEQHTTFLWPLFAYHKGYRKDASGKPYKNISTTWVLPPVYVGRHKEDREWWQSSLLVWQFKRPHRVATAVVPLFFLLDSYQERRTHALLPLYVRDNQIAKGEVWTSVIPGLYVQHRGPTHNNAVQFPLVWHFDNEDRRVTIGGFVWYDVHRKQRGVATQVLPLIYARRETDERVGHMVGPGLAPWLREAEGERPALHWRALFWLIGGGNEDGERYMWLLGGRIKLKDKPLKPRKVRQSRKQRREREPAEDEAARNEAIEAAYFQL